MLQARLFRPSAGRTGARVAAHRPHPNPQNHKLAHQAATARRVVEGAHDVGVLQPQPQGGLQLLGVGLPRHAGMVNHLHDSIRRSGVKRHCHTGRSGVSIRQSAGHMSPVKALRLRWRLFGKQLPCPASTAFK
jgi:hypothetical protein